jgi:ABC-type antimicrobial peptide transport system permease subunit
MALGATPGRVFRLVFSETLGLLGLGLVIGLPLVLAASHPVSGVVLGVDVRDPVILAVAVLVVTLTAALAAYLPARRASRVDPMVALKYE